ncbi:hypothetical protein HRbin27_00495 [bacterium HR27]|nr:hypothetical protein HRbin27_00495 [bacterium HR27]
MLTEHSSQRRMQEMCRRMIPSDRCTSLGVDDRDDWLADLDIPFAHPPPVRDQLRGRALRIFDDHDTRVGTNLAGVTDLSAGLTVERRAIEDDFDLVSRFRHGARVADVEDPDDRCLCLRRLVTEKRCRSLRKACVEFSTLALRIGEAPSTRATELSLPLERLLEASAIDRQPSLARQFFRQLVGEPVGIVQAERLVTWND